VREVEERDSRKVPSETERLVQLNVESGQWMRRFLREPDEIVWDSLCRVISSREEERRETWERTEEISSLL